MNNELEKIVGKLTRKIELLESLVDLHSAELKDCNDREKRARKLEKKNNPECKHEWMSVGNLGIKECRQCGLGSDEICCPMPLDVHAPDCPERGKFNN